MIAGVLNVSPESFYRGSVHGADTLLRAAEAMVEAGAEILDVGAMSTAPYLGGRVDADEERERLAAAVGLLAGKVAAAISVDTARVEPAAAALDAGATIVNDVTGLADDRLGTLIAARGAGAILMASPAAAARSRRDPKVAGDPVAFVHACLSDALDRARAAGIPDDSIVLDPGVGFFLDAPDERARWDVTVLARVGELAALGRPLAVGVSRKSFLGVLTGRGDPHERLAGSLAATAIAVLGGAALIRTHDPAETRDAVRVAERVAEAE